MSEEKERIRDLLDCIKYQYPAHISTFGPCIEGCGNSARGGGRCKVCLSKLLVDFGVRKSLMDAINSALAQRQKLTVEIDELCEMAEQSEVKQS